MDGPLSGRRWLAKGDREWQDVIGVGTVEGEGNGDDRVIPRWDVG